MNRQVDLDWIRVISTFIVFMYHVTMFFNPFAWHLKNNVLDQGIILVFSLLIGTWIMPIFFAISGITTLHALQKRSKKEFIKERLLRLGIPLVFGVFVLSPPQVFIERFSNHQFEGNLVQFLPHYFNGLYLEINGDGNFAFFGLHLWYLLVLLVFSILLLPLITKTKVTKGFNHLHYWVLPSILVIVSVSIEIVNLGGWGLPFYLAIYMIGYVYFSQNVFKDFIRKNRNLIGILVVVTSILYIYGFMQEIHEKSLVFSLIFAFIKVVNSWNWLLWIFYLAETYLARQQKGLKYLNQASMPFYVLHQPIIIGVGFCIYQLSWPVLSKFLLLSSMSFVLIMFFYHLIIQRFSFLRLVFGLKSREKRAVKISSHSFTK
jgi:glucans biosynthesis protein C